MNKDELKQIRASLSLSQKLMSKLLHLSLRQYQKYEWGEIEIEPARAELLRYKIKYGVL